MSEYYFVEKDENDRPELLHKWLIFDLRNIDTKKMLEEAYELIDIWVIKTKSDKITQEIRIEPQSLTIRQVMMIK